MIRVKVKLREPLSPGDVYLVMTNSKHELFTHIFPIGTFVTIQDGIVHSSSNSVFVHGEINNKPMQGYVLVDDIKLIEHK